jgi:protein subunit release factor B
VSAHVKVSTSKQNELKSRMLKLGVFEKDLVEDFIQGSGAGGQKINKTSSCVRLKHIPTGIEVRCQKERSQSLNRFYARRLLCEKIEQLLYQEKSKKQQELAKIRKQKKRRSRKLKEKILQDKKHHSLKKSSRKTPRASHP